MPISVQSKTCFIGEFRHALDAKNRITIPSKWRSDNDQELFISVHPTNRCLIVMPPEEFHAVRADAAATLPREELAEFLRMLSAGSTNSAPDKHGRLLLNADQCRQAGLTREVVLVGLVTRFEIWEPGEWSRYRGPAFAKFKEKARGVGL